MVAARGRRGDCRRTQGCLTLLAVYTFLSLNDAEFVVPEERAAAILALAAGEINEDGLARWIRDNWPKDDPA
jgi:death on curing protein